MKDLSLLEKELKICFKNKNLLKEAFCHRSYLNENPKFGLPHNERLEFLGDAVLELAVTEFLFSAYPQKPEGQLTSLRSALVNSKMLSGSAKKLGFNDFLMLSKGEAKEAGKARQYILADSFESFIGAFYLDQGYDQAKSFIESHLLPELKAILKSGAYKDSKSSFQEEAQERAGITPNYRVLKESGPDHDKHFVVGVFLAEELIAKGEGSSKQEAETDAASNGLSIKDW